MRKRTNNILILIFFINLVSAQVDTGFVGHLTNNNLEKEHLQYLNSLPEFSDSSNYYKTKFYTKYFNDSLLLDHYFKSKNLCDADTSLLVAVSSRFLITSKTPQNWFNATKPQPKNNDLNELQNIYRCSINPNLFVAENFLSQSQDAFKKYKRAYNKKPLVAAALSTIIPGLGKLYAGKTKSFIMTFILNAAYATQTIESTRKLGPTHVLSIINLGGFAAFYLSNIYGSYKAIHILRKEYKKQFLIDATRYYN